MAARRTLYTQQHIGYGPGFHPLPQGLRSKYSTVTWSPRSMNLEQQYSRPAWLISNERLSRMSMRRAEEAGEKAPG